MSQNTQLVPYPTGIFRFVARLPLQLHRLGLGQLLQITPYMIVTTRGRVSGLPRPVMLEFRRHGSKIYVISGWGNRPDWYKNILIDPEVTIQHGGQTFRARGSHVEDTAEAMRALALFRRYGIAYDLVLSRMSSAESIDLRTLTDIANEFTIVRFDKQPGEPHLPGVQPDPDRQRNALFIGGLLGLILLWLIWRNQR